MAQGDIIGKQDVKAHIRTSPVKPTTSLAAALLAAEQKAKEA